MAETLLAILLVTTSAKGSNIVFRWPTTPAASPRFSRAKPDGILTSLDNPWRAANPHQNPPNSSASFEEDVTAREWKRPNNTRRGRAGSLSSNDSHGASSGRNSPVKDLDNDAVKDEYEELFGYSSEFLANILVPQRSMCHQKFELLMDDLAFIGHPVSAEEDGVWKFKPEKISRGRGEERLRRSAHNDQISVSPLSEKACGRVSWLQRFLFVLVLDLPDPSSAASGNITKYFDIIYEQIAFPIAAVLFQEQVLSNFVEDECDILGTLKDKHSARGDDYETYTFQALGTSSIAPAMKTLYEAIKSSSVAYLSLHDLPLELQLPPYLDGLLHYGGDDDDGEMPPEDEYHAWGQEMSFGYRLPSLTAWKSLLLLDGGPEGIDPYANLRQSLDGTGDRSLVEGLIKFLENASVTLSFADMASLLDWDLETQVFPTVRWLVHHRRAKIVDTVHLNLRTIFRLPPKFIQPLSQLTLEFDEEFAEAGVPSLPVLLATISSLSDTHFFASVVKRRDLVPLYHDVVLWMLKRDMLVTVHLRIRIVATARLKEQLKFSKGRARNRQTGGRAGQSKLRNQLDAAGSQSPPPPFLTPSPKGARRHSRLPLVGTEDSEGSERNRRDAELNEHDGSDDEREASIINEPGRATTVQQTWLAAMSEGKDPALARRFEQINQYFDGKKTDDEILYRADMSRRELREILLAYDEFATPSPAASTPWTEHRNPEARTYWFNSISKESVWEKPDDLKSPFEVCHKCIGVLQRLITTQRALNQTKWKEYLSGGRKYYYNTETKESKWDMPDELLLLLEKVGKDGNPPSTPGAGFTPVTAGALVVAGSDTAALQTNGNNELAVGAHTGGIPTPSALPTRPNLPDDPVIPHNGFATFEEGEKAFMHLLRKAGVGTNWTWDKTMRAIVVDPLYRALNSLAEKKATYEKFIVQLKAKEQEDKDARLAKLRPALRNLLKGNPSVFPYTTYATADRLFATHPIWQHARVEAEKKLVFEEYVAELKQREVQESRAARSRSISKVVALFKELNVGVVTRWRDAQDLLINSDTWRNDPELQKLPTLDILLAFEDYSRVREREYEDQARKDQVEKTRRERKARENFKALLAELVESSKISARSKWKDVFPLLRSDERYLAMLGNPGSTPLDLFWDVVDAFDQKLENKIALVRNAIASYNTKHTKPSLDGDVTMEDSGSKEVTDHGGFSVEPETKEEDFIAVYKEGSTDEMEVLSSEELSLVYRTLVDAASKKRADEKRRAERRLRHLQDDLRYALKKLSIPSDVTDYEAALPLMQDLPEFKALEDEDARKATWLKFYKRHKEKQKEAEDEDTTSVGSRRKRESDRDLGVTEDIIAVMTRLGTALPVSTETIDTTATVITGGMMDEGGRKSEIAKGPAHEIGRMGSADEVVVPGMTETGETRMMTGRNELKRYDDDPMQVDTPATTKHSNGRAESPEEGEI
ncbi:unnamed protein product [Mycena citricolor]|uniref:Formin binding protein n=1 Tax=Mycena citricolor TaxID=2018698 RepID=A0AAD2H3L8_9AGAR|nr:unnamed protein product [Mycena citricolor]